MAEITTQQLIYAPPVEISTSGDITVGNNYTLNGNIAVTLPSTNLIDGSQISFTKRQGVNPTIQVLPASGHAINVRGELQGTELLMDLETGITLTWSDAALRWEVV